MSETFSKLFLAGMIVATSLVASSCSMESGFDAGTSRVTGDRSGSGRKDFGVFDFTKECGIPADKLDDENAIVLEQSFTSLPITISGTSTGTAWTVVTQAKLKISSTTKEATQTVAVTVLSTASKSQATGLMGLIIGAVAPGIVKSKANAQASDASGTTKSSAVPQKDWLQLVDGGNPEYKGLLCAGQGGQKQSKAEGNTNVNIDFSPALINSVSPLAPIERLRKEIGEGRSFKITANVQGGGADYVKGALSGTTTVRETDPTFKCQGKTLASDIAYEFINDFQGKDKKGNPISAAYQVGLPKRQVMYIDTKNKRFVAIINEDDKVDPQIGKALDPVCLISD